MLGEAQQHWENSEYSINESSVKSLQYAGGTGEDGGSGRDFQLVRPHFKVLVVNMSCTENISFEYAHDSLWNPFLFSYLHLLARRTYEQLKQVE